MKKKRLKTQATHEELLPFMDYLHGDVVDNEFAAACCYEYARELHVLGKMEDKQIEDIEQIEDVEFRPLEAGERHYTFPLRIGDIFRCGLSFKGHAHIFIRQCPSFPQKSWNQLSKEERANILIGFVPSDPIEPLRMDEVWLLDAAGIFDELKTMAAKVMQNKRPRKPQRKVYAIIEGWPLQKKAQGPWVHVMFTLDFGKTKKRLLGEFDKWLQLPENKARFDAYGQNPIGKTGVFKDRLKDLAVWRIYEGCGRDWEKANTFANDHRINCRPFHDPRQGQTKEKRLNEAPLYSEESGFLKAKRRAIEFVEIIDALASFQYGVPRHVVEI
jgi:hypothetical protein